jgi:hypothetical protein
LTSRVARALLLAAGVGVLGLVVVRIGPRAIFDLLHRVGWGFVSVSLLYAAHLVVRSFALWRSLPPPAVPFADVLRVRLAGEAVEMLTFTGPFLAEPAKGWLLKRSGIDASKAFGAVAIEYLLYTVVSSWLAAFALAALVTRETFPPALRGPVAAIVVCTVAFTAGCVVAAVARRGLIVPSIRAASRVIGLERSSTAAAKVAPVEEVLVSFMHDRPGRLGEVVAVEVCGHALLAAEIWIVLGSTGFEVRALTALLFEGAIKFIGVAFFFIPGQLGASEGVYALVATVLGYPAAAGLTVALVRRVRALIVAGVGLIVAARS